MPAKWISEQVTVNKREIALFLAFHVYPVNMATVNDAHVEHVQLQRVISFSCITQKLSFWNWIVRKFVKSCISGQDGGFFQWKLVSVELGAVKWSQKWDSFSWLSRQTCPDFVLNATHANRTPYASFPEVAQAMKEVEKNNTRPDAYVCACF